MRKFSHLNAKLNVKIVKIFQIYDRYNVGFVFDFHKADFYWGFNILFLICKVLTVIIFLLHTTVPFEALKLLWMSPNSTFFMNEPTTNSFSKFSFFFSYSCKLLNWLAIIYWLTAHFKLKSLLKRNITLIMANIIHH